MLQEYVIKESYVNQVTAHKEVTKQTKIWRREGSRRDLSPLKTDGSPTPPHGDLSSHQKVSCAYAARRTRRAGAERNRASAVGRL